MADHDARQDAPNYLGTELPYKSLYWSMAAVVITAIVFAIALWPLLAGFVSLADGADAGVVSGPSDDRPSGPLLQAEPERQMEDFQREEEARVTSYGWHDRANGLARIPLERAAELILEEGLGPVVGVSTATAADAQAAPAPQDESATEGASE